MHSPTLTTLYAPCDRVYQATFNPALDFAVWLLTQTNTAAPLFEPDVAFSASDALFESPDLWLRWVIYLCEVSLSRSPELAIQFDRYLYVQSLERRCTQVQHGLDDTQASTYFACKPEEMPLSLRLQSRIQRLYEHYCDRQLPFIQPLPRSVRGSRLQPGDTVYWVNYPHHAKARLLSSVVVLGLPQRSPILATAC